MGLFPWKKNKPYKAKPTKKLDLTSQAGLFDTEAYHKWEAQHKMAMQSQKTMVDYMAELQKIHKQEKQTLQQYYGVMHPSSYQALKDDTFSYTVGIPATGPMNVTNPSFSTNTYGDWTGNPWGTSYPGTASPYNPIKVKIGGITTDVPQPKWGPPYTKFNDVPTTFGEYDWVIVQNHTPMDMWVTVGVKRKTKCGKYYGAFARVTTLLYSWEGHLDQSHFLKIIETLKKCATPLIEGVQPDPVATIVEPL